MLNLLPSKKHSRRPRILVVDDEEILLRAYSCMLSADFEVVTAKNGKEAIESLEQDSDVSAVICDLSMPTMDGESLYRYVEHRWPALTPRFVFITGSCYAPQGERFLTVIPNLVLTKPCSHHALRSVLEHLLAQPQVATEVERLLNPPQAAAEVELLPPPQFVQAPQ